MTAKKKKSVSTFVGELNSHSIYSIAELQADFEKSTGVKFGRKLEGQLVTKKFIKEVRSGGGHMQDTMLGKSITSGYSFAIIVCNQLKVEYTATLGRGSQFRECVAALAEHERAVEQKEVEVAERKAYGLPPTRNCDQCVAVMINGVFCHETGCPNAKR